MDASSVQEHLSHYIKSLWTSLRILTAHVCKASPQMREFGPLICPTETPYGSLKLGTTVCITKIENAICSLMFYDSIE